MTSHRVPIGTCSVCGRFGEIAYVVRLYRRFCLRCLTTMGKLNIGVEYLNNDKDDSGQKSQDEDPDQ